MDLDEHEPLVNHHALGRYTRSPMLGIPQEQESMRQSSGFGSDGSEFESQPG